MRLPLLLLLTPFLLTPTQSTHRPGPNHLSGWTLNNTVPGHAGDRFPMTLVIARNNQVIRKIAGDPFLWQWMFLPDGKRVAYQSGPFHFSLQCILADINSGKIIQNYDCNPDPLPANAPPWVKDLKHIHEDWNN